MIDNSAESTIPYLAFSVTYLNKDTEKRTFHIYFELDNIYYQVQNKYNT